MKQMTLQSLLRLVESGRVRVKLSGAYMTSRSGPSLNSYIGVLAKALVQCATVRMVWGQHMAKSVRA